MNRSSSPSGSRRIVWPIVVGVTVWAGLAAAATCESIHAFTLAHLSWTIDPIFHDLHTIRAGWESVLAGRDPLSDASNPFNYPRVVLVPAFFGAFRVSPIVSGLALAAAVLTSILWVLAARRGRFQFVLPLLLFTPPVLLLAERANLDAAIFVLLAVGLPPLARQNTRLVLRVLALLAVVAAAMLKLYPAVGLLAGVLLLRDTRRWWFVAGLACFFGWALINADEITLVLHKTTRGLEASYGFAITASRFYLERLAPVGHDARWLGHALRASAIIYASGCALAGAAGWWGRRRFIGVGAGHVVPLWFLTGVGIYAGTFLLGANWAYRLVFLFLCIPLLCVALDRTEVRSWSVITLAAVVILLCTPFRLALPLFLVGQLNSVLAAWLLVFGAAGVWGARTLHIDKLAETSGSEPSPVQDRRFTTEIP